MNLTLHLNSVLEQRLFEQAQALGKAPEEVVLALLSEQLASDESENESSLSTQQWLEAFNKWVAGHTSRNPRVDDSRESLYPDRW
ncbi:MAG: hypothetical protein R3E01_35295 [Pirellulaceae bacterium]